MSEKMFQMMFNERQARTLMRALDLYSRIGIGQFEELIHLFRWQFDPRLKDKLDQIEMSEQRLNEIKTLLFDLHPNSSFGIFNKDVPDEFRVAWDLQKVIRHQIWKESENPTRFTVDSYPPDQSVADQPLAQIKRAENATDCSNNS
jgi:hypothetical protein